MQKYKNLSGESGVTFFEIKTDGIVVMFTGGSAYLYNYSKPGKTKVEKMKKLARSGKGLSTFISQHVRENYAFQIK